jgi:DNA-binding protein YbaB
MDNKRQQEVAAALRKLAGLTEKAGKVEAALEKKLIRKTDDDKVVTATANGHGEIVDLSIGEAALKYPDRLSSQATMAVMRARRTAELLTEQARQKYVAELPSAKEIEDAVTPQYESVDYHAIDYGDDARIRNLLAESMETLLQIARAKTDFKARYVSVNIGARVGVIKTNLAETHLKIAILSDTPKQVGLESLSIQIVDALRQAVIAASEARSDVLGRIRGMGGS